jgi:hypothetical protein
VNLKYHHLTFELVDLFESNTMESSSPDLIGIPLLAYKASNNEETALAIARKGYNDKDTLISEKQMRDMIESQEFYSNLIRSVANIRKYMKTYFEMTLPEMLVNEHKYLGFIW